MNKQGAWVQAIGGHLIDLWKLAAFHPSNPHSLSKFRQLKAVAKRTGATTLIETGTYLGNTAKRASYTFRSVVTIEIEPTLYEKAREYLRSRPNVECILGDCAEKLPEVLERPQTKDCLIFLDGHFSGGETGMGDVLEPAVEELVTIGRFREKVCGVVIDDFRTLTGTNGMPPWSTVFRTIEQNLPDYRVMVHLDQILLERSA